MKSVIISSLLAGAALAAPTIREKREEVRRTHPLIPLDVSSSQGNISATQYSSNWAGAVITSPPSGETFNGISGVFNVPTPSAGDGSGPWSGCAWVGIDGDTYGGAILQAGIDWTVDSNGGISYSGWYEWFPVAQENFNGFSMSAGDSISVAITSQSPSSGTVVIENQNTGQQMTQVVTAPSSSATLQGVNAEWIVEDFSSGGGLVPFANFGTVGFSNGVAQANGNNVGTSGAQVFDIQDSSGNVKTSCSIPSDSTVSCTYQ